MMRPFARSVWYKVVALALVYLQLVSLWGTTLHYGVLYYGHNTLHSRDTQRRSQRVWFTALRRCLQKRAPTHCCVRGLLRARQVLFVHGGECTVVGFIGNHTETVRCVLEGEALVTAGTNSDTRAS